MAEEVEANTDRRADFYARLSWVLVGVAIILFCLHYEKDGA